MTRAASDGGSWSDQGPGQGYLACGTTGLPLERRGAGRLVQCAVDAHGAGGAGCGPSHTCGGDDCAPGMTMSASALTLTLARWSVTAGASASDVSRTSTRTELPGGSGASSLRTTMSFSVIALVLMTQRGHDRRVVQVGRSVRYGCVPSVRNAVGQTWQSSTRTQSVSIAPSKPAVAAIIRFSTGHLPLIDSSAGEGQQPCRARRRGHAAKRLTLQGERG